MVETNRIKQLRSLASSIPNANQQVADGLNAARTAQLQDTIKQVKPTAGPQAAQALGSQQQQQAGQIALQQQAQNQQAAQQLGGQALREQAAQTEQRLGYEKRNLSELGLKNAKLIAELDEDARDELVDRQLQFQRNQAGQALLNERQLQDFAILSAKNEQELQDYGQAVQNAYNKKALMYETAAKTLKQSLTQAYEAKEQKLDQESTARVQAAIQAAEEKARRARNKATGFASAMTAVGTIGGAVVGAVYGGPAGAVLGAQVGGALGTAAGGAANPA